MTAKSPVDVPTAERFIERLAALRSSVELEKIRRYFKNGAGELQLARYLALKNVPS